VVPSAAAIGVALEVSVASDLAPLACIGRGISAGALLACVAFATALLHGLRVGLCDLSGGAVFFLLTAGVGGVMGGVWGAFAGQLSRGRKRRRLACVILALAAPLAGIAVSVARFYGSPMIFAYDPFFGYFSGTLYDTIVDGRTELWTYRAGSLLTLAGVTLVASALSRDERGKLAIRSLGRASLGRLAVGTCALLLSLVHCAEGPLLGHWQTAASIASALGARASGERCEVVYPDSLLADQAALLLRDCEEELRADEQRLGAHLDSRLTAYVFADANQKRKLMGAADTSIAKPWRREVYIQVAGYPHPILGHEVAHVVAGSFARGPFRVAGGAGGLLPNPGLIEGVAVATSPDDDELTDEEWARAMLDLGTLPDTRGLFSLGFLGQNADKSYTVAGAFVGWVLGRWGPAVVRAWYGGASLEGLTGQSWNAIDEAFRVGLRTRPLPKGALEYARAKFERPSVWARRCPHVVDALDRAADQCRDEHRFERATRLYESAVERDPHDWHARVDRARIDARFGDGSRGREELTRIADDADATRTIRDRAEEALADDDLQRGRHPAAAQAYRAIAARTLDEDVARTLEVKALSADDPAARSAVVTLLIGEPGRPLDAWSGALALGLWGGETPGPLAAYLVGKNLARHDDWTRAAEWLDRALAQGAPTARIGREVLRQRAICACASGDAEGLARVRRSTLADDSPFANSSGGRAAWLLALVARCAPP
jgi:tetratricopeptide (TPR) repeat protein